MTGEGRTIYDFLSGHSLIQRYETAKSEKSSWNTRWQNIQKYVYPDMRNYVANGADQGLASKPPSNRDTLNHSSFVCAKIEEISTSFCAQLCDPSSNWLSVKTFLFNAADDQYVKRWDDECSKLVTRYIGNNASNFYPMAHEYIRDIFSAGNRGGDLLSKKRTTKAIRLRSHVKYMH